MLLVIHGTLVSPAHQVRHHLPDVRFVANQNTVGPSKKWHCAMITSADFKSSELVDGFPSNIRVARVLLSRYHSFTDEVERAIADGLEGQRLIERVAGRAAARAALAALLQDRIGEIRINRADDGAPEVVGILNPPLVSISHGRDSAVAVAASASHLGIDLCEHSDVMRVRRVAVRFVTPEETRLAARGGVARWAALWALKEAGAKAVRRGLLDGGLRATCLTSLDPPRFAWPPLDAIVVRRGEETVAVAYAT
jgi:phosphopantetheinyl transferase (holo-ACP synthase)